MNSALSHYDTLGVARTATAAEIKRAYFKLVRVHSPENDPDGFRRITEAYTVLSDPEARKSYDAEVPIPPGVRAALERAAAAVESQPEQAAAEARRVVAVKNVPIAARFAAARILLQAAKPAEAVGVARQIVREAPQIVEHQVLLATALRANGEKQAALETAERAVALGPWSLGAWLLLSDCAMDVGGRPKSLAIVDKALASRRFEPLESIPLRIRRFAILAASRDWPAMERVVAEVASCVPKGDEAAARHVAWEWVKLGEQARNANLPDVAVVAFDAALALADHPEVRAERDRIAAEGEFVRQAFAAMEDRELPEWLRTYVRVLVSGPDSPHEGQRLLERIARSIRSDAKRAAAAWDDLADRYPALERKLGRNWRQFHKQASPPSPVVAGVLLGVLGLFAVTLGVCAYRQEPRKPPPRPIDSTQKMIDDLMKKDPATLRGLTRDLTVVRKVVQSQGTTAAEIPLSESDRRVLRSITDETAKACIDMLWLGDAEEARAFERVVEIRRQVIASEKR